MQRYLIFWGDTYYPAGGFRDYHFWADDLIEAEVKIHATHGDWAHAVDTTNWKIVEQWDRDFGGTEWTRLGGEE